MTYKQPVTPENFFYLLAEYNIIGVKVARQTAGALQRLTQVVQVIAILVPVHLLANSSQLSFQLLKRLRGDQPLVFRFV